jgi:hypothetical protein
VQGYVTYKKKTRGAQLQATDARHNICTQVGETGSDLPGVGQRLKAAGFFSPFRSTKRMVCELTIGKYILIIGHFNHGLSGCTAL